MNEERQELVQTYPEWYKELQYGDVKVYIRDNINSASRSFVAIGYYLKYIRDNELFSEDGYNTIWEFARDEFGIGKSSASRFMAINDRFSKDGNSPILLEQYKDFSSSKLSEMLTMSDEQLDRVSITTTVAEIREIKNPVKDEVVATSQQETECFIKNDLTDGLMCSGGISDKCNTCDRLDPVETEPDLIDDLDFTVRTYNCLKRAGIDTIDELCELTRDDVISIRNISQKCLDEISEKLSEVGRSLKVELSKNCIHRPDFLCTIKEASKLARSNEVDCNGKCCWGCTEHNKCGYECNASAHRPAEVEKETYNESYFVKWYFDKHPSDLKKLFEISRTTNVPGEIAKAFQMYKSRYGGLRGCCSEWSYSFYNFAGGIDLEVGNEKIHMKYGRFVKEALDIYENPEISDSILEAVDDDPEIVDIEPEIVNDVDEADECSSCKLNVNADYGILECHPEKGEHKCWSGDEEDPVEIVEADIIQTEPEETFTDQCEAGGLKFNNWLKTNNFSIAQIVSDVLCKIPLASDNDPFLSSKVTNELISSLLIKTDAYYSYLTKELNIKTEKPKQTQPELPILRNNDQRKEFIEAYETWPVWINQELTGERYYRYDFNNEDSIVVKVYYCKIFDYKSVNLVYEERFRDDWGKEEYYLLEPDKYFKDCETNKSSLVDYLKEFQKKGC